MAATENARILAVAADRTVYVTRRDQGDVLMLKDRDGDGKMDKWETYRDGSLSQLELDTKGRGTPDRRLIYRPDGAFDHIETDPTGSGTFTRLQQ